MLNILKNREEFALVLPTWLCSGKSSWREERHLQLKQYWLFHCASIMSKSKPICVQQLHVASSVTEDGDGPETAQWLSLLCCCLWTVTSSFHASVSPYGHGVKQGWWYSLPLKDYLKTIPRPELGSSSILIIIALFCRYASRSAAR